MLKMIKVKNLNNTEVRINVEHIIGYFKYNDGTKIMLTDGHWVTTNEDVEVIDRKLIEINKREAGNMEKLVAMIKGSI